MVGGKKSSPAPILSLSPLTRLAVLRMKAWISRCPWDGAIISSTFKANKGLGVEESEIPVFIIILPDTGFEGEELIYLNIDPDSLPEGFSIGLVSSHRVGIPSQRHISHYRIHID